MRVIFLGSILTASVSTFADQRPQTQELCGRLVVQYRNCATAPCPNGLYLFGRSGGHPVELVDGANLQAELEAKNGEQICVKAYEYADGSFSVLEILN